MLSVKELRWYEWLGIVSIVALLAVQFSSLYHTPIHNSYLWWGDESWLMNEYTTLLSTGVFRYPQAYGSTLNIGNPFPFTSMWVTSILYGGVGLIAGASHLIDAGRTLTALLSIGLLTTVFFACRKLGASTLISLLAVALLAGSRTFFFTSHSARYDILTSIAVTLGVLYLISNREKIWDSRKYFILGVIWATGLLISVHVSLLLFLPLAVFLVRRKSLNAIVWAAIGAGLSLGLLYLIHVLTQPALQVANNLSENLSTLPILRPFSRSVQFANLEQKLGLIRDFASVAGGAAILLSVGFFSKRSGARFTAALLLLPFVGWLAFQSAGPSSYLIHFLPSLIIGAALTVNGLVSRWPTVGRAITGFTILFAITMGIVEGITASRIGQELSRNNRDALDSTAAGIDQAIALNPAISFLQEKSITFSTTHFIELPFNLAEQLNGNGHLITYNSGIHPGFMWEVLPLRQEAISPKSILTGYFLDVDRSYFEPLSGLQDTLFVQQVDLNALYRRHIR